MRWRDCGIFTGLLLFSTLVCYCQAPKNDTLFLAQAKKRTLILYEDAIQDQSRLYNGNDYLIYFSKEEEHPYFGSDDWTDGSIVYWGELYENVPLLYDISSDQIVIEHVRGNPLRLHPEKVQQFTITDHTFVRLLRDDKNKIPDGFYDRLYEKNLKVYAKYSKTYRETLQAPKIISEFDASVRYYLVQDGNFHVVKSKRSVLQVLADRKSELKNFLRKNKISFQNDREKAIVRLAEYYDTLTD